MASDDELWSRTDQQAGAGYRPFGISWVVWLLLACLLATVVLSLVL